MSPRRFYDLTDACDAAGFRDASVETGDEGAVRIRLSDDTPVSERQLEILRTGCPKIQAIVGESPVLELRFTDGDGGGA